MEGLPSLPLAHLITCYLPTILCAIKALVLRCHCNLSKEWESIATKCNLLGKASNFAMNEVPQCMCVGFRVKAQQEQEHQTFLEKHGHMNFVRIKTRPCFDAR
jgi:hypothetical protein